MESTVLVTIRPQALKVLHWLESNNLTDNFSKFVDRGDCLNRFVTGFMGWHWEDEFAIECEKLGYTVSKPNLGARHDLLVNGHRVQCKFTGADGSVDIRNKDKKTNRRYNPDDFDFMAIKAADTIYIVPIQFLLNKDLTQTRQSVRIDSIRQFRDDFGVLNVPRISESGEGGSPSSDGTVQLSP